MERASKKARQETLLRIDRSSASSSAIARLISHIKDDPAVLEAITTKSGRQQLSHAVHSQFDDVAVVLQLPMEDGSLFAWPVNDAGKLFKLFVTSTTAYKELMQNAVDRCGHTLHLILFHDEISPGNVLRTDNKRKVSPFYIAFAEFGLALRSEHSWITLATIRSSIARKVKGGMGCCLKLLMRHLFLGATSLSNGVVLPLRAPTLVVTLLECVLLDEAAIKTSLDCKGAAGLKPCFKCKNVVSKNSDLSQRDASGYLRTIAEADHLSFDLNSNEDIWEIVDNLLAKSGTLSTIEMEQLSQASGFHINTDGLLHDKELRHFVRPLTFSFEAMHCLLAHGTTSVELHLFMQSCKRTFGVSYKHFREFCGATWLCPSSRQVNMNIVLSDKRESNDGFKGIASEVLALMPLIREFAEVCVKPSGRMDKEFASFIAMSDVVNAMQILKCCEHVTAIQCQELQTLLCKHLDCFKQAYPVEELKPKHHYSLHLPGQIAASGFVFDAFTLERKHRSIKQHANHICVTRCYEKSLTSQVLASELMKMPHSIIQPGLRGPIVKSAEAATMLGMTGEIEIAKGIFVRYMNLTTDDVIISGTLAMKILVFAKAFKLQCFVHVFEFSHREGSGRVFKSKTLETSVVSLEDASFVQPSYWTFVDRLTLKVLD